MSDAFERSARAILSVNRGIEVDDVTASDRQYRRELDLIIEGVKAGRASMLEELRAKVPSRIEIFEASKEITTTMPEMHIIFGAAFVINKIFGGVDE